jgi:hypothetical protein
MSRETDIAADLALLSLSELNDVEAAEVLSAITVPVVLDVKTKTIRRYLSLQGKIGAIIIGARGSDAFAAVCETVMEVLRPGAFDDIDYDDAAVMSKLGLMCDSLISGGVINADDKTAILELGNANVLKYNPKVHHSEVAVARGRR